MKLLKKPAFFAKAEPL